MGAFVLRRVLIAIPVLIGVTLLAFLLVDLAPGDPVTAMIDPVTRAELGEEWIELRKEQLGLNEPAPVRYLLWLSEVLQGNLGYLDDRRPERQRSDRGAGGPDDAADGDGACSWAR